MDEILLGSEIEGSDVPTEQTWRGGVEEKVNIALAKIAMVRMKEKEAPSTAPAGLFLRKKKSHEKDAYVGDYEWHDGYFISAPP